MISPTVPRRFFSFRAFGAWILIVAAAAFCFRLPRLDQRPMHTDEAVHAVKLGALIDDHEYIYNPHEFHGPTIYYFALPFVWASGARSYADIPSAVPLRIVTVFFGVGLILLLVWFQDALGRRAALCAAILAAVSPAFVFYSRYYIQEMLLVCFAFAAIVAGWRYSRSKRIGWALLAGAGLGLMHATKETCLIAYAAMGCSMILTVGWTRLVGRHWLMPRKYYNAWHIFWANKVAALLAILSITFFLSNPRATIDFIVTTYFHYIQRAITGDGSTGGAAIHNHPWHYYFHLITYYKVARGPWWSEALIPLLAIVGMAKALHRHGADEETNVHLLRFLTFYTILMTAAYSLIPYKTPWCILGFLHGMILLAGVGAVAIYRWLPRPWLRILAVLLFAAGVGHLALQSWRGNFVYYQDPRNPYVYAHTSNDFMRMMDRIEDISKISPNGRDMSVKVIVPEWDCWPLPWYLRQYNNVLYSAEPPSSPDAEMIISKPVLETRLDLLLRDQYQKEYWGLRYEVLLLTYIRSDLWDGFMETRK